MADLILKTGREKSLIRHHPWIFSGAVAKIAGNPTAGETVDIRSAKGEFLARGAYSPKSNIISRVWTWDIKEQVDENLIKHRIEEAINLRHKFQHWINSDAIRLVHGESDGLPGLIIDQYGDGIVTQILTAGMEFWKEAIVNVIIELIGPSFVYERSDADVRELEGLPSRNELLAGDLPQQPLKIEENGLFFNIDITSGHKTGFYLDQRENRLISRQISSGLEILDCFSYTGGFAVNCLRGDASRVVMVDSSAGALELARQNIAMNGFSGGKVTYVEQDAFTYLRKLRDRSESFDMIILDPPKFAPTVSHVERAARGYKDINLLAFKVLRPGGILLTFSCSGGVNQELFQKIITGAAIDAGIEAMIIRRLSQAIDHPVALNFPEGAYLKGFVLQKL